MAKIVNNRVRLELPLLGGNKYRARVKYKIEFDPIEVENKAKFRHVVKLFGDDTGTGDLLEFPPDEDIRTLVNEVITAQAAPLSVSLDKGPYSIAELNEDPEPFARDEIRVRVKLTPVSGPWASLTKESNMVVDEFA